MNSELNLKDVKKLEKKKNAGDTNFIVECMKKRFAFSNLNQEQLAACAELCDYGEISQGAVLFKKHEFCRYFFVIEQGQISIEFDNGVSTDLRAGDGFGEMALIYEHAT